MKRKKGWEESRDLMKEEIKSKKRQKESRDGVREEMC